MRSVRRASARWCCSRLFTTDLTVFSRVPANGDLAIGRVSFSSKPLCSSVGLFLGALLPYLFGERWLGPRWVRCGGATW